MAEKEHTPGNCEACAEEFRSERLSRQIEQADPELVAKIAADVKDDAVKSIQAAAVGAIADDQRRQVFAEHLDKPGVDPANGEVVEILKHFRFGHLQGRAREVSRHYGLLAATTVLMCPAGEQRAFALQMLLCAKDAAVRSVLP